MNNEVSLTVTDINNYIKNIVDGDFFLSNVTLKGEISNLKFHTRGHLYFSLKDENSKINAVMFNYKNLGLNFIPKDGMNVIVKGKVSVFTTGGSYQITVSNMKEDGIGNLYILFEELKRRLEREGLFSPEHKKKLPRIPKKVGVITASTGAAVKDIISTINRRFPLTEIILFPTLVQGVGAKENIVKMINEANKSDVDVIILGRGGGSIEDLWAFNEEIVARAIYNSELPVISAVGHETDFTIADFVADLRAPTPSAAAELAVTDIAELNLKLKNYQNRYKQALVRKIQFMKLRYQKCMANKAFTGALQRVNEKYMLVDMKVKSMEHIITNKLQKEKAKAQNLILRLDSLSPLKTLARGYGIILKDGVIIKKKEQLKKEDEVFIKLQDGETKAKIIE